MSLDEILRIFLARPRWQRVFFAFTLGLFMSCSMRVAQEDAATSLGMTTYAP